MQERLVEGAFLPSNIFEQYTSEQKKGIRVATKRLDESSGRLHLFVHIQHVMLGVRNFFKTTFSFFLIFSFFKQNTENWRSISYLL